MLNLSKHKLKGKIVGCPFLVKGKGKGKGSKEQGQSKKYKYCHPEPFDCAQDRLCRRAVQRVFDKLRLTIITIADLETECHAELVEA